MVRDPANRELGSVDVKRASDAARDPLFQALPPTFVAQAGHTDRATDTPPGTVVLASTAVCPVQAFRVVGAPVWATQFHPEIDQRSFAARWLAYAEKYPPANLPRGTPMSEAPFLKALRPSPHASAILRRFALLVAGADGYFGGVGGSFARRTSTALSSAGSPGAVASTTTCGTTPLPSSISPVARWFCHRDVHTSIPPGSGTGRGCRSRPASGGRPS